MPATATGQVFAGEPLAQRPADALRRARHRNYSRTPFLLTALVATAADPKAEVLANMEAFKDASIHNNAAVLAKILGDDLSYVHSTGGNESKADVLKRVTTGKNVITRMEFSDFDTRVYAGTVLVRCKVDLWHSDTDIVHMNVLHTWIKRPQGWQLVARQATRLVPPAASSAQPSPSR